MSHPPDDFSANPYYRHKFVYDDTLEIYPFLTNYSSESQDVYFVVEIRNADNIVHSFSTGVTTKDAYTHYYNDLLCSIPVTEFYNNLTQGECKMTIILRAREHGTANAYVENDRVTLGFRVAIGQESPILSNPQVTPPSGTESTTFEFLVDYYDPDGNPPLLDYRQLIFPDGRSETMTLKSGTETNGTYHYTTTLSLGSYSYCFSFADNAGKIATTNWYSGPQVFGDDDLVITPVIQCTKISSDLRLGYSLTGLGNWTWLPITNDPILESISFPSGSTIWFTATVASPNYEYRNWNLKQRGSTIEEGSSDAWWITFHATAQGGYALNVNYQYTPQEYAISGIVLRDDGEPVLGGVDLTLSSSEQTLTHHTDDGNFSFTGVKGGVSVTITPLASGYGFTPSSVVFNNLKDDHTSESIVAYASDASVPMMSFEAFPLRVSADSSVSFSWIGQDDTSVVANILYQYKLDGVDADWSAWVSDTSKSYDLPNGAYTFWVRAKDEAGNINQAPVNYTFVVNAVPKVVSAVRINRSVWASRVSLQMPAGASHPTDTFVLLPEHSVMTDSDLVPVRIHRADEIVPCGANEIVAGESLTARIAKVGTGWLVTLPENIAPGQSAQYDIVWGKIKYFGWQEYVSVPAGFPNGANIRASFLSDDLKLWRSATRIDYNGGGTTNDDDGWVLMDICDQNGIVLNETIMRFVRGECWEGNGGTRTTFDRNRIINLGSDIYFLWEDYRYEYHDPGPGVHGQEFHKRRYGLQLFDGSGATLNAVDGDYLDRSGIAFPKQLIGNSLWLVGANEGTNGDPSFSYDAWFYVIDREGDEIISRTVFDTIQNDNDCGFQLFPDGALSIGANVLLFWEREWETDNGDDRIQIVFQIRNTNGELVKDTTQLVSVLSDSEEKDDRYQIHSAIADNEGKVWISYRHEQTGEPTEYFYVILGPNGEIWGGPFLTTGNRAFNFSDRDGKIWAEEGGQFFVLNNDNTIEVEPRMPAWTPNQAVGNIAAHVSSDGYCLYDRWSPQFIEVNVPLGANPNSMELHDLNLWENDLHPANLNLKKGATPIWSQSGQFTGHTTIDVSGTLSEGPNVITMTQDDFLGGQVLITFPYAMPCPIIKGDVNADGDVDLADAILALKVSVGISGGDVYPDRDVNGDGRIGIEEVIYILQKLSGLR